MRAWTDMPFESLGDELGCIAPIRVCYVISYDGNKYCKIFVDGEIEEVKSGYLYQKSGRVQEVPALNMKQLRLLEGK